MNQRGSTSFNFFAVVFFASAIAFFWFFLSAPKKAVPTAAEGMNPKMRELDGQVNQLYGSMMEAESMRDRDKYMEILGVASKKLVEADAIWEEEIKARRGTFHGLMGGMNENYSGYFSPEDKFQMLSEKYNLSVDRLRELKADIELVFSEQFIEKFTPLDPGDAPVDVPVDEPAAPAQNDTA